MYYGTRTYWLGPIRFQRKVKQLQPRLPLATKGDQVYIDHKGRLWYARGRLSTDEAISSLYVGEVSRL